MLRLSLLDNTKDVQGNDVFAVLSEDSEAEKKVWIVKAREYLNSLNIQGVQKSRRFSPINA